jgi:hypothetical protein
MVQEPKTDAEWHALIQAQNDAEKAMVADGLTVRVARCLLSERIYSKEDAIAFGIKQIEKIPNLGPKSVAAVRAWMGEEQTKPKNTGQFGPGNPGKPKGATNKVTREFKATVKKLLEDNADNVGAWLVQVAEGHGENKADPAKALDLLAKLAEFAAPKLGRVEHVGEGGGPVLQEIVIKVVDADRS